MSAVSESQTPITCEIEKPRDQKKNKIKAEVIKLGIDVQIDYDVVVVKVEGNRRQ